MRLFEINSVPVRMYSSDREMPMRRYNIFQKLLLIEAGIGSDMNAVNRRFEKLHSYQAAGMQAEAMREAENLHYSIHAVLNSIDYKTATFACLIAQIGDDKCEDITEEGLARTSERLLSLGVTVADIDDSVEEVKKKLSSELAKHFPQIFPPDEEFQFYASVKQRMLLRAAIANGDDSSETRDKLALADRYFLSVGKPQNFRDDDPENILVALDTQFATLAALLDSNSSSSSQDLAVFDFYARLSYHMRQNKPQAA